MRQPKIENKYNLTIKDIRKLNIGDRSQIKGPLFWRNNVIGAWCISMEIGPNCDSTGYWIGIYDENTEKYKNKFRFYFTTYGGMCGYTFNKFFKETDISCENDLKIQELFLAKINELLDKGILI